MSITNIITRLNLQSLAAARRLATKATATTASVSDAVGSNATPAAAVPSSRAAPATSSGFAGGDTRKPVVPRDYRLQYPEFLPDPKIEWRNPVREKLERMDMMQRR